LKEAAEKERKICEEKRKKDVNDLEKSRDSYFEKLESMTTLHSEAEKDRNKYQDLLKNQNNEWEKM